MKYIISKVWYFIYHCAMCIDKYKPVSFSAFYFYVWMIEGERERDDESELINN
jgi:hypothetical protein